MPIDTTAPITESSATVSDATSPRGAPSQILFFTDAGHHSDGLSNPGAAVWFHWNPSSFAYAPQRHDGRANVLTLAGNVAPVGVTGMNAYLVIIPE